MAEIAVDPDQARYRIKKLGAAHERLEAVRDGRWARVKSDWDSLIGPSDEARYMRECVAYAFGQIDQEIDAVLAYLRRLAAWDAKFAATAQEHDAEVQGVLNRLAEAVGSGAPGVSHQEMGREAARPSSRGA
jgi:hypothetical protein